MLVVDWIKNIQAVVFDIGGTLLDFDRKESYTELKSGAALARQYLVSLDIRLHPSTCIAVA
ncbi:MAG: hypothetical protein R3E58_17465 [Phycisphaerae bacterium]